MRALTVVSVFAALMLQTAQADIVRRHVIPETLRGRWSEAQQPPSRQSEINLSADSYRSPQANCSVDWVSQTAGRDGSIYAAHLRCLDPLARTRIKTPANLILWPVGGDRIKMGADFGRLQTFRRCAANCATSRDHSAEAARQMPAATTE
jgi:hypothetical protein